MDMEAESAADWWDGSGVISSVDRGDFLPHKRAACPETLIYLVVCPAYQFLELVVSGARKVCLLKYSEGHWSPRL